MIAKKFLSSLHYSHALRLLGKVLHIQSLEWHIFSLGLKRETPEEFYDRPQTFH